MLGPRQGAKGGRVAAKAKARPAPKAAARSYSYPLSDFRVLLKEERRGSRRVGFRVRV